MKRFNKEEWIWFLLIAGWSLYLLYLLTTGEIISFINPKRIPLMWGTLLGIVILTFYQSTKLFTIPSRRTQFSSYIPIGLVLMCGVFVLTTKESDRLTMMQPQKAVVIGPKEGDSKTDSESIKNNTAIKSEALANLPISNDDDTSVPSLNTGEDVEVIASNKVVLNSENYTKILTDIEQNPKDYIGKRIQLEGFVYRGPQFEPDDFVIARMYMLCCAADAQITGLMASWERGSTLGEEQWLHVEGVLKTKEYEMDGQKSLIPIIEIETAVKLPTPDNQYVYY
ncbi:MAG: hypothetical protein K0S71_2090 [Clostridia bacterium]|jgi:putative membrane protein|nr:hypothetical protein [Clostridia bacterium]